MGHPPRIPVWLRWEQSVIYFVTICTADRKPVLPNEAVFRAFTLAVCKLRRWRVLVRLIMPDNLHVIVVAAKDRKSAVGDFSAALKRWIRQELGACWKWQPGCFDRLLRTNESLHDKWLYIREDPVRAKLVPSWEDWPYRYEFNQDDGKRSACPTTLRRFNRGR